MNKEKFITEPPTIIQLIRGSEANLTYKKKPIVNKKQPSK